MELKKNCYLIKKIFKIADKIIYLPLENQPNNLKKINEADSSFKNTKTLDNALIRKIIKETSCRVV